MCATNDDDAWFIKLRGTETAGFITVTDAAAGARAAAARGVGPAVRFAFPDTGAMGLELLPSPWREARLGDLANAALLAAVLAAKRTLHNGPTLPRQWDVFEQIDVLARQVHDVPEDLPALLRAVTDIRLALRAAGQDSVPGHADGTASNIMVNPNGGVRLVDFDCAGMTDPHYDLGVLLNEACSLETDWHAGIEMAFGHDRPHDFNRCRLHGIADDLLWGLWGLSRHAISARRDLEFFKYGCWRLLRCRMALRRPEHADRLRHL
ncbi:phosphotransferase family protein [Rhodopila sp.]|uniref:phosphotransferase family protein n=1 Tax=Rhodopila sp. TaxID=2480087 RepID=UPI003D13A40E